MTTRKRIALGAGLGALAWPVAVLATSAALGLVVAAFGGYRGFASEGCFLWVMTFLLSLVLLPIAGLVGVIRIVIGSEDRGRRSSLAMLAMVTLLLALGGGFLASRSFGTYENWEATYQLLSFVAALILVYVGVGVLAARKPPEAHRAPAGAPDPPVPPETR